MIETLSVEKINPPLDQFVPPFLESLISAARRGDDLVPYIRSIAATLGFDNFSYGASNSSIPDRNGKNYAYTTMPEAWVRLYDRMGYIEVDHRIFLTCKSAIPLIWDQSNIRGLGTNVDAFVDDALKHGTGSGVSFMLHGPFDSHVVIALDSHVQRNDEIRLKAITRNLPEIHMFGHYFHEVFMLPALKRKNGRSASPPALSRRERECLALAADGLTTKDISGKLDITSRTVQFHFARISEKLGTANRQEAIAVAVRNRLLGRSAAIDYPHNHFVLGRS